MHIATDQLILIEVKPEQPLLLNMKKRQKQVVRILTSSSLDVTGENYSRSDFAFNACYMDQLQPDRF